jgi:hypothetical protein
VDLILVFFDPIGVVQGCVILAHSKAMHFAN